MNKRLIPNQQVQIFKNGGYSLFEEELPELQKELETPLDDKPRAGLKPVVNAASVLGENQLASDYEDVIAARTAGLAADIGAISTGVMGAAPAAASLDIMSLLLNLYADLKDANVSAQRTAQNVGINSLTVAANLAPVIGQGLAKAGRPVKFAKQAIEIGQYLLAVYGIAMTPEQYRRCKYAISQLELMIRGDIEPTMYDVTRHVKELVMMFGIVTGVVRARESSYKTAADELAGSKNVDLSYVGRTLQNNPIWQGYQTARNTIMSPIRATGESIRKYLYGEASPDAIRTKYQNDPTLKGFTARRLFGGPNPGPVGKILGQDKVPTRGEMSQIFLDLNSKTPQQASMYWQNKNNINREATDYLKNLLKAEKSIKDIKPRLQGEDLKTIDGLSVDLNRRMERTISGDLPRAMKSNQKRDKYIDAVKKAYDSPNNDAQFQTYQNLLNKINL